MNKLRPDWIRCIKTPFDTSVPMSLCERNVGSEFCFQGLDHAYYTVLNQGRMIPCPDCMFKALEIFNSAIEMADEAIDFYKPEEEDDNDEY